MWILLLAFPLVSFSVLADSEAECHALGQLSMNYAQQTGQDLKAVCVRTWEV